MIRIKDLNFAYPRQQALFTNLSMHLEAGSITGLLGKNGAGKTSLLKLLAGQLHPKSGEVSVNEHNPRKREVSLLNNVFFVAEEFYFPAITIRDYTEIYSGLYPKFDLDLLRSLSGDFDLKAEENLNRLSYGQKKKFLIAFALSTKCRLLILDEPTNGLDIPSKSVFRKILAGSLDEDQLVIISTHQVKDVENLIDKIIILDNGKVIFKQTIAEISQKVCFVSGQAADAREAIYSEAVPGGYRMLMPNGHTETDVDIELLFNAITSGKKIF
jgi:ABC-2 type transport system ATP-binding protein